MALALRRTLLLAVQPRAVVSLREFSGTPAWRQQENVDSQRRAEINKLLYRSRQRGWLELDLLVGMWADRHVAALSSEELADFEGVLRLENPDLFKWLTGQLEPPAELRSNRAYKLISEHVRGMMAEKHNIDAEAPKGAVWKRGWDDWKARDEGGACGRGQERDGGDRTSAGEELKPPAPPAAGK
eukprot:scaffold21.g2170.t1